MKLPKFAEPMPGRLRTLVSGATRFDAAAIAIIIALHAVVHHLWPVGGYGFDSGQYLSMMDSGVFADLHPNGYSLLLRGVRVFSASSSAPFAFNHVLSVATGILLYRIAVRAFPRGPALAWVLAYSLCTRALLLDCWLLSESSFFLVLAAAFVLSAGDRGVRRLGIGASVALGLVLGAGYLLRTATLFAVPALFLPIGLLWAPDRRAETRRYLRNSAVAFLAAACVVVPDLAWCRAATGSFSLTQAGPWNLLYGHPDVARCEPTPSQDAVMREFCDAFTKTPREVREFGLAQLPQSPGRRLIERFGSFRAAGPELGRIMRARIAARPGAYIAESASQAMPWLTRSDAWYLPQNRGQFAHDPAVEGVLRKQFPNHQTPKLDRTAWGWLLIELRIPRMVILAGYLAFLGWLLSNRHRPGHLHLLVPLFLAGTLLFAFPEPRYFAPVELLIAFLVPRELAAIRERRARS